MYIIGVRYQHERASHLVKLNLTVWGLAIATPAVDQTELVIITLVSLVTLVTLAP